MLISEFDYELPEELIAQRPLEQRDASRMLLVDRQRKTWRDEEFRNLPQYLRENDVLVVNNTLVFPARLIGQKEPGGARVELLLTREIAPLTWDALVRPGHRFKPGTRIRFGGSPLRAEVLATLDGGVKRIRFEGEGQLELLLDAIGQTPLPPYIRRPSGTSPEDRERYQTIFAQARGAIAAPTAGLHFTRNILNEIRARAITVVEITLHVGYGTFEPVRVENVDKHRVASEWFRIGDDAANAVNEARKNGGRVVAVGTTTTRALESAIDKDGLVCAMDGTSELTITPGYRFAVVDALITNFHLPRSSLLLLVSAFAGRELTLDAYRHAVAARYRFYSYGDCMFVV